MAQESIHDEKYCACVKYKPKLTQYGVRFNGTNFKCKPCGRFVDPRKWHGGIVKFTNRVRVARPNQCPCCGENMARHRKAKKRLVDSIEHQINHPELHLISSKAIKNKKKLLESGILLPTVN